MSQPSPSTVTPSFRDQPPQWQAVRLRQPRRQPSARLQPRRRRRPHRSPLLRLPRSRRNCRRALVPLSPASCSWQARCATVASTSPRSCSSPPRPLQSGLVHPELALAGSRFAKAKPVASQIQVSAGNQPVMVPGGHVNQRMNLALAVPAKKIELRYNLRGITIRSIPSRAGRALTAISPLVEGVPKTLPVALRISGNTVLNIECPVATAARSGMFRWTSATPARQSKAAVAQRSDCCPVRPAETAMRLAARQWWTG